MLARSEHTLETIAAGALFDHLGLEELRTVRVGLHIGCLRLLSKGTLAIEYVRSPDGELLNSPEVRFVADGIHKLPLVGEMYRILHGRRL